MTELESAASEGQEGIQRRGLVLALFITFQTNLQPSKSMARIWGLHL